LSILKIGEKDRDGRQKRIEHSGRYLRASRTGGISLRAQTRVAGVNLTANSSHGLRVSTRLAKNTQVAMQNGRFVLRGRYGTDAARFNLSKSGVTVSSKTPVGSFNWIKPGRSSFKMGGVQVRGHKAAYLQAVYLVLAAGVGAVLFAVRLLTQALQLTARGVQHLAARRQQAALDRDRPGLTVADVASVGEGILAARGIDLANESHRDLFAALVFCVVCLGRGRSQFDAAEAGMPADNSAADQALIEDVQTCGRQVVQWLIDTPEEESLAATLGLMHALAAAFAQKVEGPVCAETLLSLDDACLAGGPRTLLQEAMIDMLADTLAVDLVLAGEQ